MNCSEFQECVCEIIDHRLSEERTGELMEHARVCPHCGHEYRALNATKSAVRMKVHRESVPAELYYSIINSTLNSSNSSWFQRLFGISLNPAIAAVAVTVLALSVYSLFGPDRNPMPEEANIVSQSLRNYQAVIGGSIHPQLVSSAEDVRTWLAKSVGFDVNVPAVKGCTSCAGVLSEYNGVKLAHVVFRVDEKNVIYIYQASMNDAMKGTAIGLPEDVRDELKRTDWCIREMDDHTTIVMWRYKNTLCSAVSSMKKEPMLALLTEKEQ